MTTQHQRLVARMADRLEEFRLILLALKEEEDESGENIDTALALAAAVAGLETIIPVLTSV